MPGPCQRTLLVLLPWCVGTALAQIPAPAPAPDKEAMERARRDAANPMRVIIEAGRIQLRRRSEGAPGTAPPAAAPAPAPAPSRGVASRSLAPAVAAEESRPAVPVAAPAAPAEASPEPPSVAARAPEPVALPAPAPAVVEAPPPAPAIELPPVARPVPEAAPTPPAAVAAEPSLVSMVEPVIPSNVLSRIGRLREVTADLTLRPDGRVAAVALGSGTPRAAARYLTQALEQWRFEPLAAERVHRVQLVFGD